MGIVYTETGIAYAHTTDGGISLSVVSRADTEIKDTQESIIIVPPIGLHYVYNAIAQVSTTDQVYSDYTRGVILPHHDIASPIIAPQFAHLAQENRKIRQVIVLGPNHENIGKGPAIVSKRVVWKTHDGLIRSNHALIDDLLVRNLVTIDDTRYGSEHSVAAMAPFASYYLGDDVMVTGIVLTTEYSAGDMKKLAEFLSQYLHTHEDTVLIASVDFSHYLPTDVARAHDSYTLDLIMKRQYGVIQRLDSAYLDSSESIITFLSVMETLDARSDDTEIIQKNSADFLLRPLAESTGYIVIRYTQ